MTYVFKPMWKRQKTNQRTKYEWKVGFQYASHQEIIYAQAMKHARYGIHPSIGLTVSNL